MGLWTEPVSGIRNMTPAQVSEAVSGFASAYLNDWELWLSAPAEQRPVVLGQVLRRWQATRPHPMRRERAAATHPAPYLEDLFADAQASIRVLGTLDLSTFGQRTEAQERSLRSLWGNFSRLTATGEASCVGITKSILLVTDGRIGPAFDSKVRTSLRLEPPRYSTDWIGMVDLIAGDVAAFESRHGPLADAVPERFRHLAVGRLYDMVFGPGAPSRSGSSRSGVSRARRSPG
jgi:hypothetical protein